MEGQCWAQLRLRDCPITANFEMDLRRFTIITNVNHQEGLDLTFACAETRGTIELKYLEERNAVVKMFSFESAHP